MQGAAAVALSAGTNLGAADETPRYVTAETRFGKIRGVENRGIKTFRGIPYGASTEGKNRFMPPMDPAHWTGVRDALEYGHRAPQTDPAPPPPDPSAPPAPAGPSIFTALSIPGSKTLPEGEDCLVLNVWTPALTDGRKRAVMLWLHGGGFSTGSGSSLSNDGTNLALRGDVVVVTINHRLNVLGFANFSALSPDFAASGDVGMLDIVHALKWVRLNIAQFGGDPDAVMLFGQSGGGRKIQTLLAMPSAKGLFHRAVIESGVALKVVERETAIRNAERLLAKLNIPKADIHEVQKLPVDRVMAAYFSVVRDLGKVDQNVFGFAPTVDGTILPQHPFHPSASPVSADVPVMIGCTRTEYTGLTTDAALWHLDEVGMTARIRELLGTDAQAMIDLYRRATPGASPTDIYFLIQSDYRYGAPTMKAAERRAALGKAPVYLYYFTWQTPVQNGQLKTPHNMEIPFAFDNVKISANLTGGGPAAMALADKVSDAWIAFAKTGSPNTPKLPPWPVFNTKDRPTMVLDNVSKVVNDPIRDRRLAMFRALRYEVK
ncbi:MAG: Carboxylesterase [Bryobacterales bacterium]|nr:Carboxylesterase [Bryobacterales bacterium]